MKYRVLKGPYAGQIVTIKTPNGSAVECETVGVPLQKFWTTRTNLEPVAE
ncbi:MAG: hypothetical protein J5J04_13010 [Anaerolineae bacterium]|nr:hypothetical protein [Anaerolineae bacterium]